MVTTEVEKVDDTKMKLVITVEADRVTKAIDEAARRLASSMKIPGFRPGRAPLKVLESRLGKGAVAEAAARESFPEFYTEALKQAEITPVGPPRLEVEEFSRGSDATFVAMVDIRPEFEVPDYEGMTVEHPEWELTDEELSDNLDAMRERFAEVEAVQRAAQPGDFVTLTLTAKKSDGTVVDDASAEDVLYEIPTEESDSVLDATLPGAEAGAILTFTDVLGADYPDGLAGQELEFTAIVKEVKTKTLPDLDDDFALTASEFDTIEELTEDLRVQIGAEKRRMARANLRGKVIEALAEMVDISLPESMVEEEQRFRVNRLAHQAEHNGLQFDQFLHLASGGEPQALLDTLKTEAEQTVKAQLIVDEIGQALEIAIEQRDLGEEIARQSQRLGREPGEIAEMMMQPDNLGALYADTYRRKTIDKLLTLVTVTNVPPDEPEPQTQVDPQEQDPDTSDEEE
ncbi:MAG: trigger factor [Euzebya sp.]